MLPKNDIKHSHHIALLQENNYALGFSTECTMGMGACSTKKTEGPMGMVKTCISELCLLQIEEINFLM
jgi:hypothetical protein